MTHVNKVGPLRLNAIYDLEGFLNREMRRVRGMAQGIDHQHIDSPRRFFGLGRNGLAIGHVSQSLPTAPMENQSGGFDPTVRERNRNQLGLSQSEWAIDRVGLGPNIRPEFWTVIEGVLENPREIGQRPCRSINRNVPVLDLTKSAKIVEPQNVITVRMGVDDRIERLDTLAQALRSKVRRSIDTERTLGRPHKNRRAQALVPRIRRFANPALTPDHRNSVRCACA